MFFGLDLAWADRNPSGVAVLDSKGTVMDERLLTTDDEIVTWIESHLNGEAVIAADIPLRVPNPVGARPCDRRIASAYGGRRAGPHPANRSIFLNRYGRIRGEDLAARLAALGFGDPWSRRRRTLLEVYPHPALVEVFELPERLLYKKGPIADRRRGLRMLRALLRRLEEADPPLRGPKVAIPRSGTGRDLKAIEDLLDARFCAWIAAAWGRHRRSGVELFGDSGTGHIGVPIRPRT